MTRTLKERTFSGIMNPEIQPWETEHRKVARSQLLSMVQVQARRSKAAPVPETSTKEKRFLSVRA